MLDWSFWDVPVQIERSPQRILGQERKSVKAQNCQGPLQGESESLRQSDMFTFDAQLCPIVPNMDAKYTNVKLLWQKGKKAV